VEIMTDPETKSVILEEIHQKVHVVLLVAGLPNHSSDVVDLNNRMVVIRNVDATRLEYVANP